MAQSDHDLRAARVFDDAVPAAWIGRLRTEIIRWRTTPIHWKRGDAAPSNFFEQVVDHLAKLVRPPAGWVGAEYWGRAHDVSTGVQFHFDRDESRRDKIHCPAMGTILYLSDVGGATLVVDTTPTASRLPTAGIGAVPAPGRVLTYPGHLLHGVQPGVPNRWPRVVFLVNWWLRPPARTNQPSLTFCNWNPLLQRVPVANRIRSRKVERFAPDAALDRDAWRKICARARTWR